MGIKDKILAGLAVVGSVLSAIFYVLFKQAKEDRKQLENEKKSVEETLAENTAALKSQQAAVEAGKKVEENYAELLEEARSDNKLNAFNAVNNILSK